MGIATYKKEGDYHVFICKAKVRLTPIIREEEELFSETVLRSQKAAKFTLCINGSWYGSTKDGIVDAFVGNDPVPAKETINEGIALRGDGKPLGRSSPLMPYIAQKRDYSFEMGIGDPSPNKGHFTGIGGLCPLIINGLKYGETNLYNRELRGAVLNGEPKEAHKPFLIQRSSSRYAALLNNTDKTAGRAGIGFTPTNDLIIIVQEHGTGGGTTFDQFRDLFISKGCKNACAVDGSDSVFLWYGGKVLFKAGNFKNLTQVTGIGIRAEA